MESCSFLYYEVCFLSYSLTCRKGASGKVRERRTEMKELHIKTVYLT